MCKSQILYTYIRKKLPSTMAIVMNTQIEFI